MKIFKIVYYTGFFFLGYFIASDIEVNAHPPCEQQQQVTCGYVQVVNPTTGKLEQHYVCK